MCGVGRLVMVKLLAKYTYKNLYTYKGESQVYWYVDSE